jgi:O-antigen/teichoic acid export membrane protein
MFDKIKLLASDTAIYGVSTILGRFLTFLLVPFYTNVLSPGEYGIVAYVFSLIAFLNVVYGYGMESAYFRYTSSLEIGGKEQNFTTPFLSLFFSSIFFSLIIIVFATPVAQAVSIPSQHISIIKYASWIIFFDTLAIIPFASLRMERKAKVFATIKFLNIAITVVLNVLLLVTYRYGIEGIFISNLVASILTLLLLLPTIFKNFTKEISLPLYRALLKFGLPYVPAGIATMMVQVVDRPILRALTDDATVGIYQANYRLGIVMMLVVSVFDYAWRPFFLSHAKEKNAKELFARVLTYFFLFMTLIFLVVSFFIGDVVRIQVFGHYLIHPNYWQGLSIVPIVLVAYMCLGISGNMVAGIYIEKKTPWLPSITFLGAGINVGANFILIPLYGITGAAWATFFSYFIMVLALYVIVQKFYPVQYEFVRMLKITIAGTASFVLHFLLVNASFDIALKFSLLLIFVVLLYGLKFFEQSELQKMKIVFQFLQKNS